MSFSVLCAAASSGFGWMRPMCLKAGGACSLGTGGLLRCGSWGWGLRSGRPGGLSSRDAYGGCAAKPRQPCVVRR